MTPKHKKLFDEFKSLCNHASCAFCPNSKKCESLVDEILTAMQDNFDTLDNLEEA
jgi:hypothetical protein